MTSYNYKTGQTEHFANYLLATLKALADCEAKCAARTSTQEPIYVYPPKPMAPFWYKPEGKAEEAELSDALKEAKSHGYRNAEAQCKGKDWDAEGMRAVQELSTATWIYDYLRQKAEEQVNSYVHDDQG